MKRIMRTVSIVVLGLGLLIVGFLYDLVFAGIPYQDPTPELQVAWEYHKGVADVIYSVGGLVLLVGLIAMPFIWRRLRQ